MVQLTASDLLRIWETGERQSSVEQALTILSVVYPKRSYDQLLDLSLGERDRLLLGLRSGLFGSSLQGFAQCPGCAQRLEFTLEVAQMGDPQWQPRASESESVSVAGFHLRFRLPCSRDLLLLATCNHPKHARHQLVECCLQAASGSGAQPVTADELPDAVIQELAEHVLKCDPLQEIVLELVCPACDRRWHPLLDIGNFLWCEIAACAKRLLHDVHTLAQTYGWSEAEILLLAPRRRQAYLEMVDG